MFITKLPVIEGDDYACHQHVKSLFPGDQKVLFQRTEKGTIVLSEMKGEGSEEFKISTDQYVFTLRVNPVKRDRKTGKRMPLEPSCLKEWLGKQMARAGVEPHFQFMREGARRSIRQGKIITLSSVFCMGVLIVKDADIFRKTVMEGIGHGKGLGFGLLNIFSY